jgi:hypothetical protein
VVLKVEPIFSFDTALYDLEEFVDLLFIESGLKRDLSKFEFRSEPEWFPRRRI